MQEKNKNIAYIRVSSQGQNTERQLSDVGIDFDYTYEEKASGKDADREQLKLMIHYARSGDTVWVHSICRLGRSLVDLKNIVTELNNKGVTVKFHKERLDFVAGENNRFNTLMFDMLAAFAEFERSIIKERQREGIEKAKAKGVYKKDKRKKVEYAELVKAIESGMSYRQVAEKFNVGLGTVDRAVKAHKKATQAEVTEV